MTFPRAASLLSVAAGIAALGSAQAQQPPLWSGFYTGVAAGYSREKTSFDASDIASSIITAPTTISGLDASGGNLGIFGGVNWQSDGLVFGIEGEWSRYSLNVNKGVTIDLNPLPPASANLSAEIDWAASLRGRVGVAFGGVLLYGTGGAAAAMARGNISAGGILTPVSYSNSTILPGWVLGGGIEAQLTPNWIARGEYLRLHFGSVGSLTSGIVPVTDSVDINNVRAAIAYKF
jgi:outer membrane immunogenic protein